LCYGHAATDDSHYPQTRVPQGAESKPQATLHQGPMMVGMDLTQPETRSRPPSDPSCDNDCRQWRTAGGS
ncbi:unnamed protein product, partial [Staurois parvus]